MDKNTNALIGSGINTAYIPKPAKRMITVKEVENGWIIYFDKTGFMAGETTHIAKNYEELVSIISTELKLWA